MEKLHLPHLQAAVDARTEGLIVALGSSSTQGVMASDPAHTYPAALQAALNRAMPAAHFAVLNRGIGGQDAPEELKRLDADVIAVHPQLVISRSELTARCATRIRRNSIEWWRKA